MQRAPFTKKIKLRKSKLSDKSQLYRPIDFYKKRLQSLSGKVCKPILKVT
ncbi:protein of unknown function [Legionella fallonii LLAP-10]|uniref:Uncharacterized protein n=1 Tax=Legionella fallonii LLAP-10 TaxID=1212491 RepID=A0A098G0E2_9GAMM|nr:protein of unknown function [Legionella fallonii LLAP-10]